MIPVFKPDMDKDELKAIWGVLKSGWIGLGPKTSEFEELFAKFVHSKFAIGVNSATSALHLSLVALGIGPGDEVLVPSLTFVSTAHAVLYCGAKPVFVDVDEQTLCMDPADLAKKITAKSKAIIPVHFGGHPADLDAIGRIAKRGKLFVIEDAAHAAGALYKKRPIGSISDLTCFSFHAVKNLATADGGMITTDNPTITKKIKQLRWLGIDKDTWSREEVIKKGSYRSYGWYYDVKALGFKYHMNDLTAAIGIVQLNKLKETNKKRAMLVKNYGKRLKKIKWLTLPAVKPWAKSSYHNYVVKTPFRDKLNLFLKERGISTGVHYMPIHHFTYYKKIKIKADVPKTEKIWTQLLTLPLYPSLSVKDQNRIIEKIEEFGRLFVTST